MQRRVCSQEVCLDGAGTPPHPQPPTAVVLVCLSLCGEGLGLAFLCGLGDRFTVCCEEI